MGLALEPLQHPLIMRALPVDALAALATEKLVLGLIDISWHPPLRGLGRHAVDRGIALQAASEKPDCGCSKLAHPKGCDHFPELLIRVGGLHQVDTHSGFLRTCHESVIAREEHTVAVFSVVHELLIAQIAARQIGGRTLGIKSRKTQMTAEPSQVFVDEKTEGA